MIPNSCLMYDLNDYIWDLRGTLSLLNSYIKWLGNFELQWQQQEAVIAALLSRI